MKIKTIPKIIFLIFFFALSASASLANCIESTEVDEDLGLATCLDNYQWDASQEMCCPTSNNNCVNANFNNNPPPQYSCNPGFSLQLGDPMLCCPIEGYVEEVAKPGCAWEARPAGFVCPISGGQGDCGSHPGSTGDNNMSWFCCCSAIDIPISQQRPKDLNPLGNLNVKIPGLDKLAEENPINCEKDENGQTICKVPWIGLYIKAIYEYSLSIIGLIAGITILFAGVIWLTAGGNTSAVESAKSWIIASLSGVVLLFASYLILFTINPNLIGMKPLELGSISEYNLPIEAQIMAPAAGPTIHGVPGYYQCSDEARSILYHQKNSTCPDLSSEGHRNLYGTQANPIGIFKGTPNLCTSGCGVLSAFMAINRNQNRENNLELFTRKAEENNARGPKCNGSVVLGLISLVKEYNLNSGGSNMTERQIIEKIDEGCVVIVSVRNSSDSGNNCPFTSGGHFIVLTGWRDRSNLIADVSDPNGNTVPNIHRVGQCSNGNTDCKTWIDLNDWSGCRLNQKMYVCDN